MIDLIIGTVNRIRGIFIRGPIFRVIKIISYEKDDITKEFLLSKMWCLPNSSKTFVIVYKEKGIRYRMICDRNEIENIFPYKWHEMKIRRNSIIKRAYLINSCLDITNRIREYIGPREDWYRFLGYRIKYEDICHYEGWEENMVVMYNNGEMHIYRMGDEMKEL